MESAFDAMQGYVKKLPEFKKLHDQRKYIPESGKFYQYGMKLTMKEDAMRVIISNINTCLEGKGGDPLLSWYTKSRIF